MPVISAASKSNASIPLLGNPEADHLPQPAVRRLPRRSGPFRRSTPAMPAPSSAWHTAHSRA